MLVDLSIPSLIALGIAYGYWVYWFFLTITYLVKTNTTLKNNSTTDPPHFVSVIIPASNEESVIADVVQACLRQTHKNLEVIVVAHNCTDRTREKASEVGDNRLIVLTLKAGWGKGIALNHALKRCKGDVAFIFDADAEFENDFIEKMLLWIDRGYDVVQAKIVGKNPNFNLLTYLEHMESILFMSIFCGAKVRLGKNAVIGGTGAAFKTKALKEIGYFRNVLSEDLDVFLKLTRANCRIAYAEDCVVYDEKPSSLRPFFRQRARWLSGNLTIMKREGLRNHLNTIVKDPLNFIHLTTPIIFGAYWFHIIFSIVIPLLKAASINIIFIYGPYSIWILSTIFMMVLYIMVLRRQKSFYSKRMLKLFPLFFIYSLYGYISFWQGLTVRSWKHTKTEHGFSSRKKKR